MAMASQQRSRSEFEDAITCPVCLSRYDENERKPKYLVSCCHTLCRTCLERICICSGILKRILCPICRGMTSCSSGIDSLPTNHDKLYLLKLEQPLNNNEECMNWCFTCKKKTTPNCSVENHSVIVMDSQVLNSDIQLNMGAISSRLQTCNQSILQNRIRIGTKLEQVSRWLASHQEMIGCFKKTNSSRINELNEMVQGSDITISIQQLMQLSLKKEQDLTLLSDTLKEESAMKEMMQELETIEKMGETSGMGRFHGLLDVPSLPRIREEFNYSKFHSAGKTSLQWPIVLIDSLASSVQNSSTSSQNSSRLSLNERRVSGDPLHLESRYFAPPSSMIPSSSMANSEDNTRNSPESTGVDVTIFRFGAVNLSQTGAREKLFARRRRLPSIN